MKYSYTFLTKAYQNKNAVFVATGLISFFFLFIFRTLFRYNNWFIMLYPIFGYITINRIVEPILFHYLPTFIIYCFISTKPASYTFFYSKIYQKAAYLFQYFYTLCNKRPRNIFSEKYISWSFASRKTTKTTK